LYRLTQFGLLPGGWWPPDFLWIILFDLYSFPPLLWFLLSPILKNPSPTNPPLFQALLPSMKGCKFYHKNIPKRLPFKFAPQRFRPTEFHEPSRAFAKTASSLCSNFPGLLSRPPLKSLTLPGSPSMTFSPSFNFCAFPFTMCFAGPL